VSGSRESFEKRFNATSILNPPSECCVIQECMEPSNFQAALNALREEYQRNLPNKIGEVEQLWRALNTDAWDAEAFQTFVRHAHSLVGSGATYGFVRVSQTARELELYTKRLNTDGLPNDVERDTIELLLEQLRQSLAAPPQTIEDDSPEMEDSPPLYASPVSSATVWLFEPDRELAHEIEAQLGYFSYRIQSFDSLDDLNAQVEPLPNALVVDWDRVKEKCPGKRLHLAELHQREPLLPILFLATRDDLPARLEAVRHGATAYLVKPLVMTTLIETLDAQMGNHGGDPFRILIVDDDASLASYYSTILQNAGMVTKVVMNPLEVMSPLVDFRPDLILTDMHMPNIDGLELASVLRQQEAYVSIPIVFLSSEQDVEKQLSAMLQGGDDFLEKPEVDASYLVSSVKSRVQRARVLRGLVERDSLTGLLNHTRFKEQIGIEVARALRTQTSLSFVMLDIDRFKSVNDTYGHPTGDRVIKSLSRLLQQRLRKTDILGRYGGEEFAVILPETDGSAAWNVMDEIRIAFAQILQQSGGVEFHVTVSGGIATVPPANDAATLNEAADRALYQAKRNGRNQIEYMME
jgi:diguanylate cyclase (GGDEF)-like protein